MRMFRALLTLLLCFTLPYTALASALSDPQCPQGHAAHSRGGAMAVTSTAMDAMPGMAQEMALGMAMDMHRLSAAASHHAGDHCGCPLGCTCIQAGAAPACHSGLDGDAGRMLTALQQESPPAPRIADRRPAAAAELLRPPSLRA